MAHNRKRFLVDGKIECNKCVDWKPLSEFHKDKRRPYGAAMYCKTCTNRITRENHKSRYAPGKPRHKMYSRKCKNHQLKRDYGISLEDYEKILSSQGGKCDICKTELCYDKGPNLAHLDHCHSSQAIRGILCVRCNKGLGYLQDSEDIIQGAIRYLEKHQGSGNDG